ncbi:ABC transporter permease subunit [Porticoccaceae bacterium]|nr:ABC transporter permease subunit [Porticoccaceae bacterium]
MNSRFVSLVRKELLDAVRDKRSVMAGLYYAVFTPLIMCGLFMVLITQMSSPDDLKITIVNAEGAPDLIRHLNNNGIRHSDDASESKKISLIIGDDYATQMLAAKPAEVALQADSSNEKLADSIRRVTRSIDRYSSEMAALRLIIRGINPSVVQPIKLIKQDQATRDSKGGMILGIAIFTMIYSVFISGMNLAIDTSAGERERNSLALLLSHPISVRQLVLSKITAVSIFAMLGLLLILLVSKVAYMLVPWQELGFSVGINSTFIIAMLIIGLPVAVMASALQLFVSFMAKTFKEAQSYLTIVLFVPLALSMAASYNIAPDQLRWAPVSGQQQALMELIKGKEIALLQLLVSCGFTLLISIALALGIERMLKSEKVVFGL